MPSGLEYPSAHCDNFDEASIYLLESPDVPTWVKEIFKQVKPIEPYSAAQWMSILDLWFRHRAAEMITARNRVTKDTTHRTPF